MPHFNFGGTGQKPFEDAGCPVNSCIITDRVTDKLEMPVEEYDAVLFHMYYVKKWQLPNQRKSHQRYVFFLLESPQNVPVSTLPVYKDYFNWTLTYRFDSDIWRPYGWLASRPMPINEYPSTTNFQLIQPQYDSNENILIQISQKKHLVAWFVSRCNVASQRSKYVEKLAKYIPIHIYGKCGNYSCPKGNRTGCYEQLERNYKFYLSFENSLCKDYVTEKLFGVINYNVVPVVYGGVNYSKIMPPMSYIDAADFSTPQDLADYLLYLDKTPDEYVKYFWWKSHYRVYSQSKHVLCKLCEMLHNLNLPNKVYPDIREWWGGKGLCHSPQEIFKSF
ncbi:alpha-(1,3)-fucosyltransferase C [Anabrus simplex]|uniref:alpha-(1,3)-fucosyltransferase C n=1 Tax=Anabrus simplex TaxID=316456 RepID=UPI0035A29BD2